MLLKGFFPARSYLPSFTDGDHHLVYFSYYSAQLKNEKKVKKKLDLKIHLSYLILLTPI
tara:strand:- start:348 stop:524 length:177 start_codon:yes stop_codon:yes gene_type:complete